MKGDTLRNGKLLKGVIYDWKLVSDSDSRVKNLPPRIHGKVIGNPEAYDGASIITSPVLTISLVGKEIVAETFNSMYVLD